MRDNSIVQKKRHTRIMSLINVRRVHFDVKRGEEKKSYTFLLFFSGVVMLSRTALNELGYSWTVYIVTRLYKGVKGF